MNPKQIMTCKNYNSIIENDSKCNSEDDKYRNFECKRIATMKTYKDCCSFAFNSNNTILFLGCFNCIIKALGFNNQTKTIYNVCTSFDPVTCLIWIKKSNSLISGDFSQIIKYQKLIPIQKLKHEGTYDDLYCMILNETEDFIVSGGVMKKIHIWKKETQAWICSQILETQVSPRCLSFNSQNKLILCGSGKNIYIQVIEQQNDQNWIITQTIKDDECGRGCRICFINDNKFANQPHKADYLEIHEYNQKNNQFLISEKVKIKKSIDNSNQFFPSQFIREKNILMVKQGKHINYFSEDKNGGFLLKNTLQFGSSGLFERLSDDALYQVTWDGNGPLFDIDVGSNEIQIRKIKYHKE